MDSASQLITLACQIAKAPGFRSQAESFFTSTMNDLCQHYKVKENLTKTFIVFLAGQNGPFDLPDDYQRAYNLFYTVNGYPYQMSMISLKQYDALFKDQSVANYPRLFCTELNAVADRPVAGVGKMYVYPQSTSQQMATLRYFMLRPDIANPGSSDEIPWFEDQEFILTDVARQLMKITDDDRLPTFTQESDRLLRKHLVIDSDEAILPNSVQLDPAKFFSSKNLPPTKATGW